MQVLQQMIEDSDTDAGFDFMMPFVEKRAVPRIESTTTNDGFCYADQVAGFVSGEMNDSC